MAVTREDSQPQQSPEHPLVIYNAFPRDFANMQQLIDYLPQIAAMNIDVVWLNPIQECTASKFYERTSKLTGQQIHVRDSLYAMVDDKQRIHGWQGDITALTNTANGLGMDLMFDLVLNHIGSDAAMVTKLETRHWFNAPRPPFDDVRTFKYSDPAIREDILQKLWFPYIERYVGTYGFSGIRLDAVRYVQPEVQKAVIEYADRCVRQLGHKKLEQIEFKIAALQKNNSGAAIPETLQKQAQLAQKLATKGVLIFGEFLFEKNSQQEIQRLIQGGLTKKYDLITNSIYYGNTTTTSYINRGGEYQTPEGTRQWQYEGAEELKRWAGDEMTLKRQLTKIGTIGFTGNHDERPLALECAARLAAYRRANSRDSFLDLVKKSTPYRMKLLKDDIIRIFQETATPGSATAQQLERMIKQHIATVAFASDGGYYLLSGDEYGAPFPKNVFGIGQDGYPAYPDGSGITHGCGGHFNLTGFFREINQTLKTLSIPKETYTFDICYPEDGVAHRKEVLHPQQENLRCIVRVTDNAVDVVLVNVSGKPVTLTSEHIQNIHQQMQQYNPELYHKYFTHPEKVFYSGVGVAIPPEFRLQQRVAAQEQIASTTQLPRSTGQLDTLAVQLNHTSLASQQQSPITIAYQQRQQQASSLAATAEQQQMQTFTTTTGLHVQRKQRDQTSTAPSSKPSKQ